MLSGFWNSGGSTDITQNLHNVTLQYVAYLVYFHLVPLLSLSFLRIFKTFSPVIAPDLGNKWETI
jgi:hypothetical protein